MAPHLELLIPKLTTVLIVNTLHQDPRTWKKLFYIKSRTQIPINEADSMTYLFFFFYPADRRLIIRATLWQTFKGSRSNTDANQCSLCEHITWQKLAF